MKTASAASLLQQLVAIPSVSSQTNRPLIELIQRFFLPLGWHQRLLSYKDPAGVEKLNLIVSSRALRKKRPKKRAKKQSTPNSRSYATPTQSHIALHGLKQQT